LALWLLAVAYSTVPSADFPMVFRLSDPTPRRIDRDTASTDIPSSAASRFRAASGSPAAHSCQT